jgi:putative membrane protein
MQRIVWCNAGSVKRLGAIRQRSAGFAGRRARKIPVMNWTRILVRWLIMAAALVITVVLLQPTGLIRIEDSNGWITIAVMAAVLGFVNAFVRPVLSFLSCGCIIITLGLFSLVVNAIAFQIAAWISTQLFGRGFVVENFWGALLGSIIFSVACFIINLVIPDTTERR